MIDRRTSLKTLAALAAGSTGLVAGRAALAQAPAFPTRPVRVVTPFPAGSGRDAALRLVAEKLARKWSQPVTIDNRPGGNGFIAVSVFKQGATDGHDLLQLDSQHATTHPHTYARLPYDMERDFAPLRMILRTPFFVAVAADSPYRTLEELINDAKARPGRVTYGSWFNGSPGHIGALRLAAMKGLQMVHVPFRDFGQLYSAVATKEVDWALGSVASAGAMERAGKVRFLTLAAAGRDPLYPGVPATAEAPATRGFEVSAWAGLFAPRGIAAPLRDRISADIGEALRAADVAEKYKTLGYEAPPLDASAFGDLIRRETAGWAEVIRASGLRLDA